MTETGMCARCGAPIRGRGVQGLCPKCLARLAFSVEEVAASGDAEAGAAPAAPAPRSRLRYFGDYELLEEIARGGVGVVYRARQRSLNREVAVKMLLFNRQDQPEFIRRFKAEAEAAANLQHPNIVAIHEVGEHEGQHYFSMDYVAGQNLAQRAKDSPLPPELAADYLRDIAHAVHHAHQRGVLHRDLKPSNILVDALDRPRITDFGLAKRLGSDLDLTVTGQVMGTPQYMSPEQARGRSGEVTVASDLYSLGAILYFLLTGRPPFVAETMEGVLTQLLRDEPTPPRQLNPAVPRDLETICLKLLAKEPPGRYASAQELAGELDRFLSGEPIRARPLNAPERVWRWCRRWPALAALIVALHVVGALGLAGILWQWSHARHSAKEARLAQQQTTTNLWESYLAQARALRHSGQPCRRFSALDAIAKAAAIRTSPELRDEAVAALALLDARMVLRREDADGAAVITAFDSTRGRYAATLATGEISIRLADSGSEMLRLPAVEAAVPAVERFSRDGRRLLAVYDDHQARVWELEERRVRLTIPVALAAVSFGATLSEDGRFVATTDGSPVVRYYDVEAGAELARMTASEGVTMVRLTRKGDRLVTARLGGTNIEIFALPSGERLAVLAHAPRVRKVSWDAEGRLLAMVGADRDVRIWNAESGADQAQLRGHNEDIEDVLFAADERLVLTSGWDGTILWNHETGERLLTLPGSAAHLTLSEDGRRLFRQGFGKLNYEQWELAAGTPFRAYGSNQRVNATLPDRACAFSRDGRLLASADADQLHFLDPFRGRELGRGQIAPATGLAFDADLNLWACGQEGLQFLPCRRLPTGDGLSFGPPEPVGSVEGMQRLRLSADATTLAVVTTNRVRVLDVRTRHEVFATPESDRQSYLALSPDGRWLAAAAWGEPHVEVWDVRAGALVARLQDEPGLTVSSDCAFSPDGRWLVTVGLNACVLWETGSWRPVWNRRRADLPFVAFSPDSAFILQRDRKFFLELLATNPGTRLGLIEAPRLEHLHGATAAFSHDGAFFAAHTTGTRELFVWHLAEVRRELARLGLDWDLPPIRETAPTNPAPIKVEWLVAPATPAKP